MKYLLIFLLLSFNVFAQEEPPAPPPEKMYYTSDGWFGPWPEVAIGTETPNGTPECEANILEEGMPVTRQWVKLKVDGKVKCPVEIDQVRKDEWLAKKAEKETKKAAKDALKDKIDKMDCSKESGTLKDLCEYLQD